MNIKFSLIVCTLGRKTELNNFFISLQQQNYNNFEIILVDQNPQDYLMGVIEPYKNIFSINHLYSAKGLSKARNLGLLHANGDVIAFPDDDCEYLPNTLLNVANILSANNYDGLTGRSRTKDNEKSGGSFNLRPSFVTKYNVWNQAISYTIFLKKRVIKITGEFDETLGVGCDTPYLSGEETDYIIRSIQNGAVIWYDPNIIIYHPVPSTYYTSAFFKKAYSYGCGMGRVLSKNKYVLWFKMYHVLRPTIVGIILLLLFKSNEAKLRYWIVLGRVKGLLAN